jgi:prepilin signal peptidase PulO-like enzyme (type II secretory pathway)
VLLALPFCALLAIVTVTDLARRVIPNRALATAAAVAVAVAMATDPASLPERIAAAALGGGALLPIALARPDGLGMGDVKLVVVIGLYLGAAAAVAVLVAFAGGTLAGAVLLVRAGVTARRRPFPFAPFLAAGGLVGLLFGDSLVRWYVTSMLGA